MFRIENLTDGSYSRFSEVGFKSRQQNARPFVLVIHLQPGIDVVANQPGPHRPLMMRCVA